ncbi:TlpA family protein disulfide reductase [Cognataquiflexum rubidum]|uniref:TlpA family protein disulfide reductase n=1 Tax=Cognataquiflexum rubidum TaxID=2922273 RepID=UPI001F14661F|nr:TlpA disulfide reductase family protein [Cognataquiflexum rubidum]MCH6233030.1 TlpA family protein disulfide reductase [Cognataquiflexum rubidum]
MKITVFYFILLFSLNFQVFSQEAPSKPILRSWYATDGSNELRLLITQDFALYEGEFWEVEFIDSGKFILKNLDKQLQLSLSQVGKDYFLENGTEKIPVQSQKSTDLKNRKVGQSNISSDFFKQDQVLLQGLFVPKESMPSIVKVMYNHAFSEEQMQFSGDVDEHGKFKVIFPLDYPNEVMVQIGNAFFTYYATPGAKQAIVVDESSFRGGISSWNEVKNLDFMGDLAVENEERRLLVPEFMKVREYFLTDSLQKTLDPENFMEYRIGMMKKHEEFYKSYFDSIPVSDLVKDINLRDVRINTAKDLMRYIWLHNGIVDGRITVADVPDDYIQDVKKLIDNDLMDLISLDYPGFIREFTMPMRPSEGKKIISKVNTMTYDFLKTQDLSESQMASVENWRMQLESGIPADSLVLSEEFKELSQNFKSDMAKFYPLAQWEHLQQKINDLGDLPRSSIIAIFLDMSFQTIGVGISESILNQLDTLGLKPEVLALIQNKIEDFERTKNQRFIDGVAIAENGDNVIAQLKEKYPGKVIYIDVWATWCGPCISEFKYAEILKKTAPEEVVFAYICGSSEREAFENQVKKFGLVGEHFFLDKTDFQKFDKELNITGFPTYMLITKEGNLVKEGILRPSSGEQLVQQLNEFVDR